MCIRDSSKTVAFEDINYQLAQADDKTAIFENWCDFLNYFDASVSVSYTHLDVYKRQQRSSPCAPDADTSCSCS